MAHEQRNRTSRCRLLILITASLLVVCVLVAVVVSAIWWLARPDGVHDETNPVLIDTTGTDPEVPGLVADSRGSEEPQEEDAEELVIRMSQGEAELQDIVAVPATIGEPLPDEQVQQILARLPELVVEQEDQVEFLLPEDSLPPPRAGETIQQAFPPPMAPVVPDEPATGPLEVLRHSPEGDIPLAPFVNVTFNQPMVPLATLAALTPEEVPVRLEPSLPGTWKWLGTKTLSFEYDSTAIDRLPMATDFHATVPDGTQSATGGVLAEEVHWTFSTPPPAVISSYPSSDSQPLDPLFVIAFDQRIQPEAVLETIQVIADNQTVEVKLASEEELQADKRGRRLVERAGDDRWVAFVAEQSLPADASVSVTIGPGTPSAEGPRVTEDAQSYSFRTYALLRIESHQCAWYGDECPPLTPFVIRFNNPIDASIYQESMLRIEPSLPDATVDIVGNSITIHGTTRGRTTYRVTIDGSITDLFGQTLGEDTRLVFKVGSAQPALFGPDETLVTLDPALTKPILTLYAVNYGQLKVRAYQVQPSDWPAFRTYLQDYQHLDTPPEPPGRKAMDETLKLEAAADELTEVNIDLSPALEDDVGHIIVIVEPQGSRSRQNRYSRVVQAWVQVTQIGLDAFADHSEMVVWATGLKDGTPLPGVTVESSQGGRLAVTGEDGTATFSLAKQNLSQLVARLGNDTAILPKSTWLWDDDSWQPRPVQDELRWYVFDDRAMYRPGEEVHVKGWVRRVGGRQDGDVSLPGQVLRSIDYQVVGPQGNDLLSDQAQVNALGGFDLSFTLPAKANLGYSMLVLEAQGTLGGLYGLQYNHRFQVQEFRRPEFEVSARNETTGPYFAGGQATVAVEAAYYAGGPLPNAEVNWQVSSSPGNYSPPNWPDFSFGHWSPWWYHYEPVSYGGPYGPHYEESTVETFAGLTDATGNHYLRLDFEPADTPRPFSVLAEAMVVDVNRQGWAASTSLLVHPAELYVGLRSKRIFVERGQPLDIEVIVTDLDGIPVADRPVEVQAARLEWKYRQGSWHEEAIDIQDCTVGSTQEPVSCTFETAAGGKYQITAHVSDSYGRRNESQFTRWVSGGSRPPARKVEQEEVTLIPDQETYQPGDVAQILVQSPFSPAEGLLTLSRSGILATERFHIDEDTITLQVPIDDKHIPNLNLQVDLVGSAPRTDAQGEVVPDAPSRPAYASGELNLSVPPLQRTLSLGVTPVDKELEPGGETALDLVLTDASGQPVADAELAVVIVDEAILALTGYQLTDPLATFYRMRPSDVSSHYGRASIVLASPEALEPEAKGALGVQSTMVVESETVLEAPAAAPAPAEDAANGEPEGQPIRMRTDFDPLATFAPEVRTDANGQAQVAVKLPDNLTRYRVMVVAVADGSQFGSGETSLLARLPLMVRPSAPRFLNFGDRFELPVVIQNQTYAPLTVDTVLRAANLELTGSPGQRVTVPARDRVEVRFPATTTMPGTARFQVAAVSGDFADAATGELPVYTPATTEAFATYGVLDQGAVAQPLAPPSDVYPQFGGLEISTSSTALQALTDAVLYLVSYRFECSEQLASRILAVAALRDVLTAFSAEGLPAPGDMEAAVERDIEQLQGLQNRDGGFPYWRRGRDSIPFNTIHVAHALQRAVQMDFYVPPDMRARTLDYLSKIEDHYPEWYSKGTRYTLTAYALYVRDLMGDGDVPKARRLLSDAGLDQLSLEAAAWLWQVLDDDPASAADVDAVQRHIGNRAVETAGAASFATRYSDQAYLLLRSDRRTDAIILDAMIASDPQSDLIPKIVNGLLAHRTEGRWKNTQENVFVLLALDSYFNTFEAQTPDFVARVWLGDTYAAEHTFEGRTTERHQTTIPMAYLADGDEVQDLIVSKEGPGRLYYRLGLRYSPTDLAMDPVDMGFVVQRSYEPVDDPEDVVLDKAGVWHIKAGARVRVHLSIVADNRRYHVALVDPLPAGLEIMNPALAVSGDLPQDPSSPDYRYGWWWWGTWYEHQNMRDERAEAFASLVWEGVYSYSYVARATTPGTFVVPPAKAEEMYSPEVFGRSGSNTVVVE